MKHLKSIFTLISTILVLVTLTACGTQTPDSTSETNNTGTQQQTETNPKLVATTTHLTDLAQIICGEHITVIGLMGTGIDPHQYLATAGDMTTLQNANIIFYHGLDLEGKMTDIFQNLSSMGKNIISVEESFPTSLLLDDEDGITDPHIWFDVARWQVVAENFTQSISALHPEHSDSFKENLENYSKELETLENYIISQLNTLPDKQKVLITSHDAFSYFGDAYNFEVLGLQGISTNSEATTTDISNLATRITEDEIKAIFVESSVSSRNMEALQSAVEAKGGTVQLISGLYSDSLGDASTNHSTYIQTVTANIDLILSALQ